MSPTLRHWIKRVSMLMLFFSLGAFVPRAEAMRSAPLDDPDPWLQPRLVGQLRSGWGEGGLYNCQILFTRKNYGLPRIQSNLAEFNQNVMFRTYADKGSEGAKVQIFQSRAEQDLYVVSIAGSEGRGEVDTYLNNLLTANLTSQPGINSSYQHFVEQSLVDAMQTDDPVLPGTMPLIPPGSRIVLTGHSQGGNVSQNVGRVFEGLPFGGGLAEVAARNQVRLARIVVAGSYINLWSHRDKNLNGLFSFVYGMQEITDPVPKLTVAAIPVLIGLGITIGVPIGMSMFRLLFVAGVLGKFLIPWMATTSSLSAFGFGLTAPIFYTVGLFMSIMLSVMIAAVVTLGIVAGQLIKNSIERNQITFKDDFGRKLIDAHSNSYNDVNQSDLWVPLSSVGMASLQSLTYLGGYAPDCATNRLGLPDMIPDDERDENGCITNIGHNLCDPPAPDPETVNPPQGQPDDYEAPWTISNENFNASDFSSLIADSSLRQGTPAWKTELKASLRQRVAAAEAANQPQALEYFSLLEDLAEAEQPAAQPTFADWTPQEHAAFETMFERQMELGDEQAFALATGSINGAPATVDQIEAHWQAVNANDPLIKAWKESPAGQEFVAAFEPLVETTNQFEELVDDGGLEQISGEVAQIERQVKTTGVGLLTGGLTNWAASTMSYSGASAQRIDPGTVMPADAPPVLVVPSGAIESYRNYPLLKSWLDDYARGGGTLIVLSQPYGRNWEQLPGGQVRGLGYEEDIFCREESVDVINESPYLAGLVNERPSLQLDGSFTQYPPDTRVLLKRRTGNVMPAMIEYPYGAGKVIATSLFPDFAPINGSQSLEDMVFARSFFLQAWREATNAPLVKKLKLGDAPIVPVTVTNNGTRPLRSVQVVSDIAAGVAPDMWRYRIHYDDSDVFHSRIHEATATLAPPLAPGESRVVNVTFPELPAIGLHRVGVRGQPADLFQVDPGLKYTLPAQMRISTDQAAYWTDDVIRITAVLSPTPALTTTRSLSLRVLGNTLPPVDVTLQPGQIFTTTANLQATEAIIGRPLRFRLVTPNNNRRVVDGLLPINIEARATPVRLRLPFDTRVHWVGDTLEQPIQLQPTALLTETIPVRIASDPPLLTPRTVTLEPGTPISLTASLSITSDLITGPLRITASHADTGALLTRNQIWLRVTPLEQRMDVALAGPASTTSLPFTVRNVGGVSATYSATVELLDGAERVISSLPVSGTLDRAAANTHAPTSQAYALALPGTQETSARYSLRYRVAGEDGQWRGRIPASIPGVSVSLETETERPTYLVHEEITATTTISTSAPLSNAWLRLQVLRLGNGTILDVATMVGAAGQQGSADGVGGSARFYWPYAAAFSGDSRFALVADTYNHTIRYVEVATGVVSTLAGAAGSSGNGNGVGALARFSRPRGVAVSRDGTFALVADTNNHTIRRIALPGGEVTTLAGSPGLSGSANGIGNAARFTFPDDLAISGDGAFALVADNGNHTIRRIDLASGAVTTLAGLAGQTGSSNGAGSSARFNAPQGIALSADDTFALVADTNNATIRRVTVATGYVVTLAGRAGNVGAIDGAGGTARFSSPQGLAITPDGKTALVADTTNHTIRRIDIPTRKVTTVAGAAGAFGSNDGTSDQARFRRPRGVALSADGSLALIADSDNQTIRSLGFATLLRENWLPVNGADPINLDYAMVDPRLADDVRARGQLLLRGTLFGPQPAGSLPSERQVLAVDQTGFVIASGAYTVSLVPDQDAVRVDTADPRDDQAARVRLRGTVRNVTPVTGVTLTPSYDGVAQPALQFPDLAPGASADFEFSVTPGTAGDHSFSVQTPDGAKASAAVAVVPPAVEVGPIGGAGATVAAGSLATLTVPVSNTGAVVAFVDVAAPGVAAQSLELAAGAGAVVSLQVPVGLDAPAGAYVVPITLGGDLSRVISATLLVAAPPIIPPLDDPGGVGAATIQGLTGTPQPVRCGSTLDLTVAIQPTAAGRQVLEVVGVENQAQLPLVFETLAPLSRTVTFTVPATLPSGEYPVVARIGDSESTYTARVDCWSAALELRAPSAGVAHGTSFPVTVAVTETAGVAAPAVIEVRYGDVSISRTLQLQPNQTVLTTLPLTADIGVGRVSAFLSAPEADTEDPAYQPIIDSRPVSVYLGDAFVELTPLQAPAGTTLTGELVITGPITTAQLSLPESMGGDLLLSAGIFSTTAGLDQPFIDLRQTPTGRWSFSVPLAADMQRGRYALDFYVNGVWQPVPFDVEGPQAIVSAIAVTELGDCTPRLNLTLDVESATAITVWPVAQFERRSATVAAGPIQLKRGRQTISLPVDMPAAAQGSGRLAITFNSAAGNPIGGATTTVQRGQANLISARLEGAARTSPAQAVLDVVGNGAASVVIKPDIGAAFTTTHQLSGYRTVSVPLTLDRAATMLRITMIDPAGCRSEQTLFVSDQLPDNTPPTVTLDPPTPANPGTATVAPVVFRGTATDADNLICSVAVNGQAAAVDPATGAYSVTLHLPPGSHEARATASDCGGNQGSSGPQSVSVQRTFPKVQFANSAAGTLESTSPVTIMVTLDQLSSITTTVRYVSDGGSATPGEDYGPISGTLTFAPYQRSQTLAVPIMPDALDEFDETVVLRLSDPVSATLGYPQNAVMVLVDDDAEPTVGFSASASTASPGAGVAQVVVSLSEPSGRPVWVDYTTVDGTALAGQDYDLTRGALLFPTGVTSRTLTVPLRGAAATGRQFSIKLSNPIYTVIGLGETQVTIGAGPAIRRLYIPQLPLSR